MNEKRTAKRLLDADRPASRLDALVTSSLDLQERTRELYRACIAEFVAFAGDDPYTYTPGKVEEWLFSLLKGGRQPQTVNVYRKAIRYASRRWAKHRTEADPRVDFAATVDKVKVKKTEPREPLTFEEAGKLLATCAGGELVDLRDRALIVLALRTGLRRGGLCALELAGIQPPRISTRNKGGATITFEADTETLAVLKLWTDELRRSGIGIGQVFRNVDKRGVIGAPLSAFQIWKIFKSRAKQAQIRHVFPHLARHTTVTWLRESGMSSAEVSKLTGQTERTIEDIYTHVRLKDAVGEALPSLVPKKGA